MFEDFIKRIQVKRDTTTLLKQYKVLLVEHENNMSTLREIQSKCYELGVLTKDISVDIEDALDKGELCRKRMLTVIDSLVNADYRYLKQQAEIAAIASNDYTILSRRVYGKLKNLETLLKRA